MRGAGRLARRCLRQFKEEKIMGCCGVLERNKDQSIALKGLCQVKKPSDGLESHSPAIRQGLALLRESNSPSEKDIFVLRQSPGSTGTYCVDLAGLEFTKFCLPLPSEPWEERLCYHCKPKNIIEILCLLFLFVCVGVYMYM